MPIFLFLFCCFALVFFVISAFLAAPAPAEAPAWRWRLAMLGLACVAAAEVIRNIPH